MGTYKTNTPNFKVNSFDDFKDKKIKNNLKDNHIDTQNYMKNTKLEYDEDTAKMTEFSKRDLDSIEKEIEDRKDINEAIQNTINSMSRLISDYKLDHDPFENRGFVEGITILQNLGDLEEAYKEINTKIREYERSTAKSLSEENKQSIINGLNDALKNIKTSMGENIKESMSYKMIKESKKKRNRDLKRELNKLIREYKNNTPVNESKESIELSNLYIKELLFKLSDRM